MEPINDAAERITPLANTELLRQWARALDPDLDFEFSTPDGHVMHLEYEDCILNADADDEKHTAILVDLLGIKGTALYAGAAGEYLLDFRFIPGDLQDRLDIEGRFQVWRVTVESKHYTFTWDRYSLGPAHRERSVTKGGKRAWERYIETNWRLNTVYIAEKFFQQTRVAHPTATDLIDSLLSDVTHDPLDTWAEEYGRDPRHLDTLDSYNLCRTATKHLERLFALPAPKVKEELPL